MTILLYSKFSFVLHFKYVGKFILISNTFEVLHSIFVICNLSALTEKIVAVLPKLKCPHAIEPHQIQGLDFIHIYPVVQVSGSALI